MGEATATEATCFEILAHVGSAKSSYIEAIEAARTGDFEEADQLLTAGDEAYHQGHELHFQMLQKDVSGEQKATFSLILLHTEDQMASAETLRVVAKGFSDVYRASKEMLA